MLGEGWKHLPAHVVQEAMGGAFESGGGKVGFYRRLNRAEPSPTLVTSPIQKATMLCHPTGCGRCPSANTHAFRSFLITGSLKARLLIATAKLECRPHALGCALGQMLVSVAQGNAKINAKRMRGTSVHRKLDQPEEDWGDDS